jgi:hypothetical protein
VSDAHITHVEHDGISYYFWCEAVDCYANSSRRYEYEAEAADAAAEHEQRPG